MRLTVAHASLLAFTLAALSASTAFASSFNLTANSTTPQTLGPGSGQTGTIAAGVSLTVSGSTVAVTISGNNATVTNLGTISQTGTGRVIRDNTGVSNLVINNGSSTNANALMIAADADVVQMNKSPASVTLNNYGTMNSLNASAGGSQAVDFTAIASGANTINNYSTGLMIASQADGVRPGVNGVVYNAGTITAVNAPGGTSDGIDAQNDTGVSITNDTTGLIDGARHGITGGAADSTVLFSTSVINKIGGIIRGDDGSGINLDGFNANQTATIANAGTITGSGVTRDGDGVDVDGLINLTNTGTIKSLNSFSSGELAVSEGVTVGGGTILNSGTIQGLVASGNTNAIGRGITLAGNDITSGSLSGTREAIYGDATITNQSGGLIMGQSDSGIAVDGPASGHTVTITNAAGATIQGGGTLAAAIRTGADNDIISDAGLIDGSNSGKAIDMGGGNNTLNITGGSASILGSIDGGAGGSNTLTIDPGTGNTFAYDGSISDFLLVETRSGLITLSGVSVYTGVTRVTGGVLELEGANRLASGSSLDLNGGTLETADAGGVNGQTFDCLSLDSSSTLDLDATSLTFGCLDSVTGGKTLSVVDYVEAVSPVYAFRFSGDLSTNAAFLALIHATTIDGNGARFLFDGTFTDVLPAPDPGTLAPIASGGILLLVLRRRRRA